jgi:hypothetical protein
MTEPDSVTEVMVPNSREGFCQSCGKPLSAERGTRRFWGDTCRQRAHRLKKVPSKQPIPVNLKARFEARFDLGLIFQSLKHPAGVVELWHPKYGRGVLGMVRIIGVDGEYVSMSRLRCLFRNPSGRQHWELVPMRELWTLAFHREIPKHLRWVHPKFRASRQKKIVQLFDSDRNRDLWADSEKWNRDGGARPEAETAIEQMLDKQETQAGVSTGLENTINSAHPHRTIANPAGLYADRLADLVAAAKRKP